MSKQDLPVVLHNEQRGLLSIEDGKLDVLQLTADGRPPKRLLSCPTRLVLRARLAPAEEGQSRRLELFALGQKASNSHVLNLRKIHVLVEPTHSSDSEQWVDMLMAAAYPITQPYRRVLLLVNPVGGKGKARSIVKEKVLPLLEAAGCKVKMVETTHRYHAEEIAKTTDLDYDVIASASGDGNVYEVLNGFASRPDARKALRTPVAPIPTGSANACCTNLFGVKDTFNVALATLNAIKGQPLSVDLCSVLLMPSQERRVCFLSQALGLMVDLDIGTENLRWMGDTRFMYGFIRGIAQSKACKARLRMDVVTDNKEDMARMAREAVARERSTVVGGGTDPLAHIRNVQTIPNNKSVGTHDAINGHAGTNGSNATVNGESSNGYDKPASEDDDGPLPPAAPLVPTDSWVTIESMGKESSSADLPVGEKHGGWKQGDDMLYMYAGMMPFPSRDLNQWPVVQSGSGLIDVVVQKVAPRGVLLSAIGNAEHGETYWEDSQCYYKVRAYTAENLDKANQPVFAIDGEAYPWDSFHVEVLPRAGTLLSLDGRFFHSKFVTKSGTGKKKK